MVTLEQAAKAWAELGRVMYPSLAEVEAALAGSAHVSNAPIHTTDRTAQQIADEEEHMSITPPEDILAMKLEQGGVPSDLVESRAAELLEELRTEWDLHPAQMPWGGNSAVIRQEGGSGWSVIVNGIDIAGWVDDWTITPEPGTDGAGRARLTVTIPLEHLDMRAKGTP